MSGFALARSPGTIAGGGEYSRAWHRHHGGRRVADRDPTAPGSSAGSRPVEETSETVPYPNLGRSRMDVHLYAWVITVAVTVAILAVDVFVIGRRPHEPSMKEAG